MDYKKLILNLLLNKYEESRHYTGDAKVNRRIVLPFNRKTFPQYDIEKTEIKEAVHYALYGLEGKSIISVQWVKFEKGNIVDKVCLNTDNIDSAYIEAVRKPKKDIVSDVLKMLGELKDTIKVSWILHFVESQMKEIEETKNLTKYIPRDEYVLCLLIDSLKGIDDKGEEEILERVFSKRYLGGSKLLETKIRSRLCTIIRDFYLNGEELEDEEALQEMGIIKTVEELLFFGPLTVKLFDHMIDFAPFVFGASMNTGMIKNFEVVNLCVKSIITIENKANYIEFTKKEKLDNTLVMYLGGFYSPVKRIFIKKVYDYLKTKGTGTEFYHWGDVDLGGFKIFMQLKAKLIGELVPLYMDVETLRSYKDNGDKFDGPYGKKLEKLLGSEEYVVFHEVIKEMLTLGIKLEQEALL